MFIAVVIKYDKIEDDDETGEPRLVSLAGGDEDSYTSNKSQELLREISAEQGGQRAEGGRKRLVDERYGSVLVKERESVFSDEDEGNGRDVH